MFSKKKKLVFSVLVTLSLVCFSQVKPTQEIADKPIEINEENKSTEIPFAVIENVPIYPGCDKTKSNWDLKECMSEKIQKLVGKKFNTDVATTAGLTGKQRIIAAFKIDKEGNIIDIKARASHPVLEEETIRVIGLIPQMERPGIQRGKPVIVPYSLPIIFQIVGESKPLTKKEKRRLRREGISKKIKQKN